MSEDEVRETYEAMRYKYPNGAITEAEFIEAYNDKSEENQPRSIEVLKFLFATIDYDHSGNIDLYEHMLALGLFGNPKNDPEVSMKCLFQLCDSNHDGILTKDEIAKVVYIFVVKLELSGETKQAKPEAHMKQIMDIVNKAFGDKAQLSEQEFRKIIVANKEIQELAKAVQGTLVTGLLILSRNPDSD